MRRLRTALLVFTSLGLAACSGGASGAGSLKPPMPVNAGQPGEPVISSHKDPAPPSPNMVLSISPTSGPVGMKVAIRAIACIDTNGLNHAVSFNRAAGPGGNMADGRDPSNVVVIPSVLSGTTLTARYTVTHEDMTFGGGVFFVQCGQTVKSAVFSVTGR